MAPRNRVNVTAVPFVSAPEWAGKQFDAEDLLPGGAKLDDTAFTAYLNPVPVTLSADASAGAAALTVTALSAGIPAGTMLNFGLSTGGTMQAYVIAAAAAAATSLVVSPLVLAIPSGSSAKFPGLYTSRYGAGKTVPSGTFVSRTYAQRAAGGGFHPAVVGEDEFFLTAFDVTDVTIDNDVALVMPGDFPVKENFLPAWGTISTTSGLLTALRARYVTTLGAE